jgi:transketolase
LFHIPKEVADHCREAGARGARIESEWSERVRNYGKKHRDLGGAFDAARFDKFPKGWERELPVFPKEKPVATRAASGKTINAVAAKIPTLIGGSADLTGSNNTRIESSKTFALDGYAERNIHFGVREHAMGAAVNGMALHGGVVPFAGTFLIFSDYMRPAIRLSALMRIPSTFVFTHDSIGLGEDGPTHQPIEHLMSLRAIPGLTVFRPADANETAIVWGLALSLKGPRAFVLTRQALPILDVDIDTMRKGVARGAYVVVEASKRKPDVVLVATGSEVHLAIESRSVLESRGVATRVVSMPSRELFLAQAPRYRNSVLARGARKVSIEAGATLGWREIVGDKGAVIGLDRFGASAPGPVAMEQLGFNVDNVVNTALSLVKHNTRRVSA